MLVSVFHFLEATYPYTHSPATIWWLVVPERKSRIATGCQSQASKCNTGTLLSSTGLIHFCYDIIPFTFHSTQQEGTYAIFMRSWALLHGLFSSTINQCISLHCRLFPLTSLWTVLVAHGCSFLWVPRHTLLFGCKTPCFPAVCFTSGESARALSWIPLVPDMAMILSSCWCCDLSECSWEQQRSRNTYSSWSSSSLECSSAGQVLTGFLDACFTHRQLFRSTWGLRVRQSVKQNQAQTTQR